MQAFRKYTNSSGGGVTGLSSASGGTAIADNKIIRGDGTTGIQASALDITDGGNLNIPGAATKITFDSSVSGAPQMGRNGANVLINGNDGSNVAIQVGHLESQDGSATDSSAGGIRIFNGKQVAFSDGTDYNRGIAAIASGVTGVRSSDGSTGLGWFQTIGFKRKTADQTVTNSTTLVSDSHLSISLAAGRSYKFRFCIYFTDVLTSGFNIVLGGTATHTALISRAAIFDGAASLINTTVVNSTTASTHGASGATGGLAFMELEGTTTVNAAGTFLVQFAQNVETGAAETITLHRGSTLEVWDIA